MCKEVYTVLNSVIEKLKKKDGKKETENGQDIIAVTGPEPEPTEPLEGTPMEEH
jgi:hypothetical protein